MPQERFQCVNSLQYRNGTAVGYREGTNSCGTLAASPFFFIRTYKLGRLLGKKSDPAYLSAFRVFFKGDLKAFVCGRFNAPLIYLRENFPLIKVILIYIR